MPTLNERGAELRERRQRLSLDAIGNAKARVELEEVESALAGIEADRSRNALAEAEQERREIERQRQEQDERQAAALAEARRLQGERQAAAAKIDKHAALVMEAIAEYYEACAGQQSAFVVAGRISSSWSAEARAFDIEAALIHFMRRSHLPKDFLRGFPAISPQHVGPLAERDPHFIDKE